MDLPTQGHLITLRRSIYIPNNGGIYSTSIIVTQDKDMPVRVTHAYLDGLVKLDPPIVVTTPIKNILGVVSL